MVLRFVGFGVLGKGPLEPMPGLCDAPLGLIDQPQLLHVVGAVEVGDFEFQLIDVAPAGLQALPEVAHVGRHLVEKPRHT